jgi:hypothetical protein
MRAPPVLPRPMHACTGRCRRPCTGGAGARAHARILCCRHTAHTQHDPEVCRLGHGASHHHGVCCLCCAVCRPRRISPCASLSHTCLTPHRTRGRAGAHAGGDRARARRRSGHGGAGCGLLGSAPGMQLPGRGVQRVTTPPPCGALLWTPSSAGGHRGWPPLRQGHSLHPQRQTHSPPSHDRVITYILYI